MCLPLDETKEKSLTEKFEFFSPAETIFTVEQLVSTAEETENGDNLRITIASDPSDDCATDSGENDDVTRENYVISVSTDETFSIRLFNRILSLSDDSVDIGTKRCKFENCDHDILPSASYCLKHFAANDADQKLFEFCRARHTDFSLCKATVPLISNVYHKANIPLSLSAKLCEEHCKIASEAEKVRLKSQKKMNYLERCRAKRARKLARDELRAAKLEAMKKKREAAEMKGGEKRARVSATVRIWKKRRRRQPRMIQTGGKSLTNILSRPYPDYEWELSNSQSSSSESASITGGFSEPENNTIGTFSTANQNHHSEPSSPLEGSPSSKLFEDAKSEISNFARPPPARPQEPLTPELSDDSLQGLQLPGCLESPSFFTSFDSRDPDMNPEFCFTESLDKFMSGVLDGVLSPNEPGIEGLMSCPKETDGTCEGAPGAEGTTRVDIPSKDESIHYSSTTAKTFEKSYPCSIGEHSKRFEIEDTTKHVEFVPSHQSSVIMADHDYSTVSGIKTLSGCLNSSLKSEGQLHPNKWLDIIPSTIHLQPKTAQNATTSVKGKFVDEKDLKKDPILCQPKADALKVVRVKFRAPIIERGKDPHFGSSVKTKTVVCKKSRRKANFMSNVNRRVGNRLDIA